MRERDAEKDDGSRSLLLDGRSRTTALDGAPQFEQAVGELSRAVIGGAPLRSLAEHAAQLAATTLDLAVCAVLEYRADHRFVVYTSHGELEALQCADLEALAQSALHHDKPVITAGAEGQRKPIRSALGLAPIERTAAVLITHRSQVFGAIVGCAHHPATTPAQDAAVLANLAELLGFAVFRDSASSQLEMHEALQGLLVQSRSWAEALTCLRANTDGILNIIEHEIWQGPKKHRAQSSHAPTHNPAAVTGHTGPFAEVLCRLANKSCTHWLTVDNPPQELDAFIRSSKASLPNLKSILCLPIASSRPTMAILYLGAQPWFGPGFLQTFDLIAKRIGERMRDQITAERVRKTLYDAPIGIADRSLDGRWLRVNEHLCKITGYSEQELLGKPVTDILHPADAENERALFDAVRTGQLESYTVEKRYLRQDGSVVWVSLTSSAVQGPKGAPAYCVVVVQDITARRAAERKLRESEERFRHVLTASPVPLMVYSDEGDVLALSRSWTQVTGYQHADIPTIQAWTEFAFGGRVDEVRQSLADALRDEAILQSEFSIDTKAGEQRDLKFNSVPLGQDSKGRRLRLAAAADVTQLRRSERQLLAANQQKDDFIAMLSHELRNPLAAINHASSVLEKHYAREPNNAQFGFEHLDDEEGAALERALRALGRHSQHMAKLLDGLLEVSRMMRGKIALDRRKVDLAKLVREALSDLVHNELASQLELQLHVAPAPPSVDGDPVRLMQIIDNLLANAIKYTPPPGQISIELRQDGLDVILQVSDTGDGIEPELLPVLFEPFRQGRQALDRARGGLGVGLSLVRSLVELHGGSVSAESPGTGLGSRFTVRLPRAQHDAATEDPDIPPTKRHRVVLIDDNEDAAEMLRFLLQRRGHEVAIAFNGSSGIALVHTFKPDVVLCDIGLPGGVSGFDVAVALRGDPALQALRLVALTGYGRESDQQRCTAAGFDAHLTKPASLADIEGTLQ